jgi:hypothetical protein
MIHQRKSFYFASRLYFYSNANLSNMIMAANRTMLKTRAIGEFTTFTVRNESYGETDIFEKRFKERHILSL